MAEKDATARLRRAVKENNLFLVKRLIKRTDMRNSDPSNKRYTSLAWAAVLGHEETFEFLLSSGHDDHEYSKDSDNNTILILLADVRPPYATAYGAGPSDPDFLSATLRMARLYYDRYPDILDWANIEGKTALHVAALKGNEDLVRMLCDLGADYDLADNDGNTPLHYASAWGHIQIVQLLIERGCQYSTRNNEGFTPSDYAYSISTRDTLQDAARTQFELNKKARRNVFAQAAARGTEWGAASGQMHPPTLREYEYSNGSVRMRSGSGTSRTTATSESDLNDSQVLGQSPQSNPSLGSSLSPSRFPIALPSGAHFPAQASGSSSSTFSGTVPPPSKLHSASPLALNPNPASVLSPIATRMRERDADAMEKYKMRQRSGSATTASTDTHSQNGSAQSVTAPGPSVDDLKPLSTLIAVGSVAPRRRLRPSASAAQLHSPQPPSASLNTASPHQENVRNRSGTSPAKLTPPPLTPSPTSEALALPTPTQSSSRPSSFRPGQSDGLPKKSYTGPPSEYAKFPPPPLEEHPERSATPTIPSHLRRLPFNLLSSHKNSLDSHIAAGGHRRNASANTAVR
ncbi:hypothetical protein SCP_0208600 [Sparassis crispa]|uniref:Uncharacterized protein n=1 Tax=Sparassis crispa TaxID=139825 RepID=A0A401GBW9_9APHY|nr:hypothetical protein SCP_0208600 [Sparassis crispa]GBE79660.1 hypothetical protein SCP_0208600 [Sparassis crispa]